VAKKILLARNPWTKEDLRELKAHSKGRSTFLICIFMVKASPRTTRMPQSGSAKLRIRESPK
jgi:hypothetical protein